MCFPCAYEQKIGVESVNPGIDGCTRQFSKVLGFGGVYLILVEQDGMVIGLAIKGNLTWAIALNANRKLGFLI